MASQEIGALSRRLAALRRPPLVCQHQWEGTDGGDVYICRKCGGWWCYDGNETAGEPPFAVQERAAGAYDGDVYSGQCAHGEPGHCIRCARLANDPVEARHRALTAQRVAVARAAINPASPLSDLFL